jgi:hypothetical protein
MTIERAGMPPNNHISPAVESPTTSKMTGSTRLLGPQKGAAVSAGPVRRAEDGAKKTFMDFLEQHGGDYAQLVSLTGN